MLNLRERPDAASPALAALPPDGSGVEVVALSGDGARAQVNAGEAAGWAALRFLAPNHDSAWTDWQVPPTCAGAEPFWSIQVHVADDSATLTLPEDGPRPLHIAGATMAEGGAPVAGFRFEDMGTTGFATIIGALCRDGMSDRGTGLSIGLFLPGEVGLTGYSGCCRLAP